MPDTKLTAPPTTPTLGAPPETPAVEPRVESHDWVFVGYLARPAVFDRRYGRVVLPKDGPTLAMYLTDEAELNAGIRAWQAREDARVRYPYIFLSPRLKQAFEGRLFAHLRGTAFPTFTDQQWTTVLDLAQAYYVCGDHPHGCPKNDACGKSNINHALVLTGKVDDREFILGWDGLEDMRGSLGAVRGTLRELIDKWGSMIAAGLLYAYEAVPGGWVVLLHEPDGRMRTPTGQQFQKHDARTAPRSVLPVSVATLLSYITGLHNWSVAQAEITGGSCQLPSEEDLVAWLRTKDILEPEPGAEAMAPLAVPLSQRLKEPVSLAPPAAVLPCLAWPGRVTLLAAREKDGKSTLVGSGIAAVTNGRPWLGQPTAAGDVLLLTEESQQDTAARLTRYGANLDRVFPLFFPQTGALTALRRNVAERRPALVVIDSLVRYAGDAITQDTSAAQWERVMSPILEVARMSGTAILVLHHAGKKDGEYRDSTEIGAAVDMLIQMPKGIHGGNRQTLNAVGRIVGIEPYSVTISLADDIHQVVSGSTGVPLSELPEQQQTVLQVLKDAGATIPSIQWEKATGLARSTFQRARDALIESGHVVREGTPGSQDARFRPAD